MATNYSLVCWGGSTGKTVSLSATTDVVTLTNHGLRNGAKLWPSGTLPAELNASTPVYARSTGLNTFTLHTSAADAIANTGQILFAGSSTYAALVFKSDVVANAANALSAYGLSDLSRWGARIFDSIANALTTRIAATTTVDDEVVEVFDAFTENSSVKLSVGSRSLSFTIWSKIGTKRTPAFHAGDYDAGYVFKTTYLGGTYEPDAYNTTIDGLGLYCDSTGVGGYYMIQATASAFNTQISNCIIAATNTGQFYTVYIGGSTKFFNNIVMGQKGSSYGGVVVSGGIGSYVYNNLVTKCAIGFKAEDSSQGRFYNNVSVGNTVNWGKAPNYSTSPRALGNIGETTDLKSFTATAASSTLTTAVALTQNLNAIVFVSSTGSLPTVGGTPLSPTTPYYIKTLSGTSVTISSTRLGAALVFDGVGTGTHYINMAWATSAPPVGAIDFSVPNDIFVDWTNNDFRSAGTGATPNAKALQVDSGVDLPGLVNYDIADAERPNYNNGGAEYKDAGPFEYDRGYGNHPASHVLTLNNIVVGSRVFIRDQADTVTHFDQIAAASTVTATITVYGDSRDNWRIKVRNASGSPAYVPYETLMTATAGSSSLYVSQTPDE